jgi:DNA polymerase III subunit delta'
MTTQLIGQEHAESTLARALAQDRVSHAYLFVGPESVGKTTAAVLLAQALNCRQHSIRPIPSDPSDTPEPPLPFLPCGECEDCRRIAAGTHPDVHLILPGSKTGQNISVEQVRELRQDVARRPIMGRRKLYLIPNAEAMNDEAANTLLKTLEEPPENVTLVLMAPSPTRVLPTILSRCQVVRFTLAPGDAIHAWLEADGIAPETAAALALTSGGRPGLARRWSREPDALARRRQVLGLLAEIAALRRRVPTAPAESIAALRLAERARSLAGPEDTDDAGAATGPPESGPPKRRGSKTAGAAATETQPPAAESRTAKPGLLRLLEVIRSYYRDLLLCSQGAPDALIGNADSLPALTEAAVLYTPGELVAALEAIARCQQFLERNVAPQLAFETLFLALLQPET